MTSIGENIKRLRNERDWSQAELGEKIGKTRTAIWQYERGEVLSKLLGHTNIQTTINRYFKPDVDALRSDVF